MAHQRRRNGRLRKRLRQRQGFSRPFSKQWYDFLQIPGSLKREFFNMQAKNVVAASAVTAGACGLLQGSVVSVALLGLAGAGVGMWFVKHDRMSR